MIDSTVRIMFVKAKLLPPYFKLFSPQSILILFAEPIDKLHQFHTFRRFRAIDATPPQNDISYEFFMNNYQLHWKITMNNQ